MAGTVQQVRLLIADQDPENQIFPDGVLQEYLDLNKGRTRRAAADALDAIATSEALISKVIRTQDLQTDGAKVADALRQHADRLRQQEDEDDPDWFGFEIADTIPGRGCSPEHTGRQVWGF